MRAGIAFVPLLRTENASQAGEATLSGVFVETDDRTGLAQKIRMVRLGGRLEAAAP